MESTDAVTASWIGARKKEISNYSADPVELIAPMHAGIVVCVVAAARVNKDVALSMKALRF